MNLDTTNLRLESEIPQIIAIIFSILILYSEEILYSGEIILMLILYSMETKTVKIGQYYIHCISINAKVSHWV